MNWNLNFLFLKKQKFQIFKQLYFFYNKFILPNKNIY